MVPLGLGLHAAFITVLDHLLHRYVNCSSMAARSVDAVRNGDLKIVPEFHEATWYRWLENIR